MIFDDISRISGIGARRLAAFRRLGIERRVDFLFHNPRRYEDRRTVTKIAKLEEGKDALIEGKMMRIESSRTRSRLSVWRALISDDSGAITVTFFNQNYIAEKSPPGCAWVLFGTLGRYRTERVFLMKEIDLGGTGVKLGKGTVLPFYPATSATPQWYLRRAIADLVRRVQVQRLDAPDYEGLPSFRDAARMVHCARSPDEIEPGRRRLAMDELTAVRLCVEEARRRRPAVARPARRTTVSVALPFTLTGAQTTIKDEILGDLEAPCPMRRLVEGDVGSGKTVLAILAAARVAERGQKTAFLAPTEILAEQHFLTWGERLRSAGLPAFLLTGATSKADRKEIHAAARGEAPVILFGTHALFSGKARFEKLGLVVVDEQQRFGVAQREELLRKGEETGATPDLLILSATPIPRTLAMTLYGDLDISILAERLPGREEIPTIHLREGERKKLMPHLRAALSRKERVYIVYPVIEEAEGLDVKNAKAQFEKVRKAFPEVGVGLLTGAMKSAEKEETMRRFRDGGLSILVSTTVIEVGIDVPEATVMIIEHAEHFGLSQIHQLRGRVGRSARGGVCILTTPEMMGEYAEERMKTLVEERDGFKIAEADLRLRGPGEILGETQHGRAELKIASLARDADLIPPAAEAARRILDQDPDGKGNIFIRGLAARFSRTGADAL